MEIYELVIEMKLLKRRLSVYEEKYRILSEKTVIGDVGSFVNLLDADRD